MLLVLIGVIPDIMRLMNKAASISRRSKNYIGTIFNIFNPNQSAKKQNTGLKCKSNMGLMETNIINR